MRVRAGFNVETVEYKNISFTVWDVGGQDKVSPVFEQLSLRMTGREEGGLTRSPGAADPAPVAALLPEHAGLDLRGGQQRP